MLSMESIENILEQARDYLPKKPNQNKDAHKKVAYLEKNKEEMRYQKFREHGLLIGSGVIEATCKTIVATSIIALRCATLSNRLQDYWDKCAE